LGNLTASSNNSPGKKDKKKSKKDNEKSVASGLGEVDANDFYGN
jgi:hypothetical protein